MTGKLEPMFPPRPGTRSPRTILLGFTAALCWWIGIAGSINSAGGALYLLIPALATVATLLALRRPGRPRAKHIKTPPPRKHRSAPAGTLAVVVVLGGFSALLSWWIAIVALLVSGGGSRAFVVFLLVPIAATTGTFLAARRAGWAGRDIRPTLGLQPPGGTTP